MVGGELVEEESKTMWFLSLLPLVFLLLSLLLLLLILLLTNVLLRRDIIITSSGAFMNLWPALDWHRRHHGSHLTRIEREADRRLRWPDLLRLS